VTARITEWQPTSLRSVPGILFFGSALGVAIFLARRPAAVGWPALAWLAVFFIIGAYAIRGVAWWPLGAAYAMAGLVATASPDAGAAAVRRAPGSERINSAIVAVLIVAGVALLPVWRPTDPSLQAPAGVVGNAPPGVTASLREIARPGDRLFNPQPWGSWFEFVLPDVPVAIDSRIEVFPPAVWDDYGAVTAGEVGWEAILDRWGVTIVVAPTKDEAFVERLKSAGWRSVFQDEDAFVLVKAAR
jgi:hypothetical protein